MTSRETCTSTRFYARTQDLANALVAIVKELEDYWPLTVRQVYYQAVSRLVIPNQHAEYRRVSKVLVKLREEEDVPWEAIEDRTRRTTDKRGWTGLGEYVNAVIEDLDPMRYGRCRVQGQDVYVEVSTEKDALSSIMESVVWPFCTRLNVVRGQVSATLLEQMSRRFSAAEMKGQTPILLHFGDLDPSGVAIPKAINRLLYERHDIDVKVLRVALNPDQVDEYNLPQDPDAVRETDPNHRAWLEEYGEDQPAVELDALHPEVLTELLEDALADAYDMKAMDAEMQKEVEERLQLGMIQRDIKRLLRENYADVMEVSR